MQFSLAWTIVCSKLWTSQDNDGEGLWLGARKARGRQLDELEAGKRFFRLREIYWLVPPPPSPSVSWNHQLRGKSPKNPRARISYG